MSKKVLIIGDTIIDKDVYLQAIGLSLESPTMKTSYCGESISYGGAANVAKYASYFGLDITFVSCMSSGNASIFSTQNNLTMFNLDDKIENTKIRYYVDHGNEKYKYLQVNNTNKKICEYNVDLDMDSYDIIAFSDYRSGVISEKIISDSIASTATTFGASQVSSHQSNFNMYQDMDYLICNEHESTYFSRRENVIITKGSNGCTLNNKDYQGLVVENPKNIIGAGDCFYAAYLAYEDLDIANDVARAYIKGNLSRHVK